MMRRKSRTIALCGVLTGLSVVLMMLGGMFPGATYCAPLLASLVLIAAQEECGTSASWLVFAAAALLSGMLCADKEAALLFLALGYYPILKGRLDAVHPRLMSQGCKLLLFNAAVAAVYAVLLFAIGNEALREELLQSGVWFSALLLALGNLVFWLYDVLLTRLYPLYRKKLQPTLRKIFK